MQTLIGRQAQAPGATFTHAQAVQSSQAFSILTLLTLFAFDCIAKTLK
jgi:hypothetical protein